MIEANNLPEGDKVYLKKDFLGYRIVNPIKNEDGNYNWFNLLFGGKKNLVYLIILLIILFLFYFGYQELNSNLYIIANNPCDFCKNCLRDDTIIKPLFNLTIK